ncbi:serine protease inhibitor 3/4-like isoform X4 [Diorhabda carinulata]|uniref:serine protease inhibitor 3/4-like isoform X4 n=1 Tax=Diorhabda carinulata TaxID=1163345 RepID=UPI00259FE303|nr:serine protease inhibitor 3/4-like isoform X4 [Diorhabda carinulata]XP_057668302.1 serine protease inhibitor 3/4-like isoform X4 [Diorhabda carinulata]
MVLVKVKDFESSHRLCRKIISHSLCNVVFVSVFVIFSPKLFLGFFHLLILTQSTAMSSDDNTLSAVLQGNALFTRNAYQIFAEEKGKNIFFSPISIHSILSLAAQGAKGDSQKAFIKALQVSDIQTLASGYQSAMKKLNSIEDVTLLMANKVYVKQSYLLQDEFKSKAVDYFLSEVQNIDFTKNIDAAKTINNWVEGKTNSKIKDLIQPDDLDDYTRLILINAIYFKGKWAEPFDRKSTKTEKFYLNKTDTIDVQMMHTKKKFYFKNDEALDAKVLELPYTNRDLSMIVILPNQIDGIDDLEAKLAKTDLTKITENMYRPDVIVALPKFKIETTIDLEEPLKKMGLDVVFTENADFSGMLKSPEPLCISKVIHKAFIEVNEEGAEAAAATVVRVALKYSSNFKLSTEKFIVKHPFVIILVRRNPGNEQNHILFTGRIRDPKH